MTNADGNLHVPAHGPSAMASVVSDIQDILEERRRGVVLVAIRDSDARGVKSSSLSNLDGIEANHAAHMLAALYLELEDYEKELAASVGKTHGQVMNIVHDLMQTLRAERLNLLNTRRLNVKPDGEGGDDQKRQGG